MKGARRISADERGQVTAASAWPAIGKKGDKNSYFKQFQSQPDLIGYQLEFGDDMDGGIGGEQATDTGRWYEKGTRRKALKEARSQQLAPSSPERSAVVPADGFPKSRRSRSTENLSRKKNKSSSVRNRSESITDHQQQSTELTTTIAENFKMCFSLMELAQRTPGSDTLLPIDEGDDDNEDVVNATEAFVAKENVARHRSFHNKRTILPAAPEAPVATTAAGSTGVVGRRKPRRAVEAEQVNGQQGTGEVRQLNTDAILKQLVPESNRNSNRNSGTERQERIVDVATGSVYYRGKLLGKGGFAKCYELIDAYTPSQRFAGKIIPKPKLMKPHHKAKILREIDLHRHLSHNNIVAFFGDFEDDSNIYIVLEICTRKSMVSVMKARKTLLEPEVRYYMSQLVEGCKYIHSRHIIHRDLKLGNMLVSEQMEVKITDFGLATEVFYVGEKKTSVCGTPNYISPEVLSKRGYSYEVDIWAMGCIMYAMLVGKPPFETPNLKETYARIVANKYYMPLQLSSTARALIKWQLAKEPFRRPTLDQIVADEYFTTGYFPKTLPTHACYRMPHFPHSRHTSGGDIGADVPCTAQTALTGTADLVGRPLLPMATPAAATPASTRPKDTAAANVRPKENTNAAAAGQPLAIPYIPIQVQQQQPQQQQQMYMYNGQGQRQDMLQLALAMPVKKTPSRAARRWKSVDAIEKHDQDRVDGRGRSRLGRLWQGIKQRFRSLSRKRKKNSSEKLDGKAPEDRRGNHGNVNGTDSKRRNGRSEAPQYHHGQTNGAHDQKPGVARQSSSSFDELDDNGGGPVRPVPLPKSKSTQSLATPGTSESDDADEIVRPPVPKTIAFRKQSAPVGPLPHSTPLTNRNVYGGGANFPLLPYRNGVGASPNRNANVSHTSAMSVNMSNASIDLANFQIELSRRPSFTVTGDSNAAAYEEMRNRNDALNGYVSPSQFMQFLGPAKFIRSNSNMSSNGQSGSGTPNRPTPVISPNGINLDDSVTFPLRRAGSFPVTGSAIEMYHNLKKCLRNMTKDVKEPPIPMRGHSPICITKWVDYSVKYGFGFLLTDGSVGVLFPDTTRMLLAADDSGNGIRLVHYNDLSNNVITFSTDETPVEYKSKCTLLFYFSQYMADHLVPGGDIITRPTVAQGDAIFLKKWFRTSRAIVMYLSNGTLQINFVKNHRKIIINSTPSGYCATFISSKRQATSFLLESLRESGCRQDMLEGLQYAGRVMENIVNFEGESV